MIHTIQQAINKRAHQLGKLAASKLAAKGYLLDMAEDRNINSIQDALNWIPNNKSDSVKGKRRR